MQAMSSHDKREKEAIHSGHFMVSHFEAEEQDDEDDVAVPVLETEVKNSLENIPDQINIALSIRGNQENGKNNQQLSIETNLSKLFQCMSLAYRQKLTSPKWNRFRGIKLRWKDKIRLNNVIWRCWHMQFIMKQDTLICQFASPLDVDTHNKPEAIVLEGKYWKRKLQAVTAEYKKWRMFYRNQSTGGMLKDALMTMAERDALNWNSQSNDGLMMVDEDYMDFMSDTLFSTIANQPFVFPDSREIARAGLAEFIQPSLGPLQPNLEDFMDTFEPLNELLMSKLPSVPEEQSSDNIYKPLNWDYSDLDVNNMQMMPASQQQIAENQYQQQISLSTDEKLAQFNNEFILGLPPDSSFIQPQVRQSQQLSIPSYSSVISKPNKVNNKLGKHTNSQGHPGKTAIVTYTSYTPIANVMNKETISVNANINPMQNEAGTSRGYKFAGPVQPNIKFTNTAVGSNEYNLLSSRNLQTQLLSLENRQEIAPLKKEVETNINNQELGAVSRSKATHHQRRQRSRSSSRDQGQTQRPPLLTAVSDPAIISSGSSVLLTQLLTSNNHLRLSKTSDKAQSTSIIKREDISSSSSHPVAILPAPPPPQLPVTTLIITTPTQPSRNDTILLNPMKSSPCSPVFDHNTRSQDSPESPLNNRGANLGSPSSKGDSPPHGEHRRIGHIHAEHKRRCNIKNGFDMIHSLIPHLNQNPNTKLSKAAMLQKGADYIRQLRSERNQLRDEMDCLRQQIECLNTSISNCQSMLPATGAPVSRRCDSKMQDMFDQYVRNRTLENWKFWIFSLMIKPLLTSYNNFVSTSSFDDLYRSTIHWVEQHCTLVDLRPVVLNSLRFLCTKTDILSDPEILPEEARRAVINSKPVYP